MASDNPTTIVQVNDAEGKGVLVGEISVNEQAFTNAAMKQGCNSKCLGFWNICVWLALIFFIVTLVLAFSNPDTVTMWYIASAALGVCVLVYWITICCDGTCGYLRNFNENRNAYSVVQSNQLAAPHLGMWCECYHYETRTRSYTDSNGNRKTETYTEKVTTYRGSDTFRYGSWADVSGQLQGLENFGLIRLKMEYSIHFADSDSNRAYDDHYQRFCQANRWRDTHFSSGHTRTVPGFTARVMSQNESVKAPKFLSLGFYILSAFFSCGFPYALWLQSISHHAAFFVKKTVSVYPHLRTVVITQLPARNTPVVLLKDDVLANVPAAESTPLLSGSTQPSGVPIYSQDAYQPQPNGPVFVQADGAPAYTAPYGAPIEYQQPSVYGQPQSDFGYLPQSGVVAYA